MVFVSGVIVAFEPAALLRYTTDDLNAKQLDPPEDRVQVTCVGSRRRRLARRGSRSRRATSRASPIRNDATRRPAPAGSRSSRRFKPIAES